MQPLGDIGDLEADASCQEEEDEEEEAVWLREQGHREMGSVQDHPFHWLLQQQAREAAGGAGEAQEDPRSVRHDM